MLNGYRDGDQNGVKRWVGGIKKVSRYAKIEAAALPDDNSVAWIEADGQA